MTRAFVRAGRRINDDIQDINSDPLRQDNQAGTGVYIGGLLTINGGDNTKIDISAGEGIVVDHRPNPVSPKVTVVKWEAYTGIDVDGLLTSFTSYIAIDKSGNVTQFTEVPTARQRRDNIVLGIAVHTTNTVIEDLSNFVVTGYGYAQSLVDLSAAVGIVNTGGNIYSANGATDTLAKTAGTAFRLGGNYANDAAIPNTLVTSILTAPTLFKPYRADAAGSSFKIDFPLTNTIDFDRYDDGTGTLATKSVSERWSVNRVFYDPVNENTVVQYGQNVYRTSTDALLALTSETFIKNPVLEDAVLRSFLLCRRGGTDLSDSGDALFIAADKFGQSPAEGAQIAYSNGIATVTSAAKSSGFTTNLNKAYQVDNSSNAVTGTLAEATSDQVGKICECWIQDDASVHNFTLAAPTEASVINGVSAGVGQTVKATVSSANSNYKKISVTVIDTDTYLIDGVDSVVAS